MNFKKILVLIIVSSILIGCVCAAGVTDFKADNKYKSIYSDNDCAIYADEHNDTGISIYKALDTTDDDDDDSFEAFENFLRDDGNDYLTADDDLTLDKNADYTANFTDTEHGTAGISELVEHDGQQYVIVVWSINTNELDFAGLVTTLNDFNKANDLVSIEF